MKATNHFGDPVKCVVCQSDDLKNYKLHFPPFADAINARYIGWCKLHEKEGIEEFNKAEQYSDRIKQASSNS